VVQFSPAQRRVLVLLAAGEALLKAHRDIEGSKVYRLHPLDGAPETVERATVESLVDAGLLDSNKKFPAATFMLTDRGRACTAVLITGNIRGLSMRTSPLPGSDKQAT